MKNAKFRDAQIMAICRQAKIDFQSLGRRMPA
jgi:hypothetical protein